ncbi:MAG: hypothetical protein ACKOE6_10085, partial [Flammeovirgaceae bacterium]
MLVLLLLERKVYGVLEVTSLKILPLYKVAYLERAAESVALSIYNRQTSVVKDQLLKQAKEQTFALVVKDQLLEQAKEKTFALQQQEEEMRQNMEELV